MRRDNKTTAILTAKAKPFAWFPLLKKEVEQGFRAACRSPAKRLPDAAGNAFCKNEGRISQSQNLGFAASLPLITVGYGKDPTIRELAEAITNAVGFAGALEWDSSKPDGMQRKLMNISWRAVPIRSAAATLFAVFHAIKDKFRT